MEFWNTYSEKFLALTPREKWLICLGGIIGIVFILLTLFVDPVIEANNRAQSKLKTERSLVSNVQAEIEAINKKLRKNPNKEVDAKLKKLMKRSQDLSLRLSEVMSNLLSPSQMAELLETVLDNSKALKLVSLESLPAEPVLQENGEGTINYYIHPVRIELTGKYFDIKDYLKLLEDMPVKYFWKSFSYNVEEYPQARLILVVYTLGTRQEFIGG